MFRKKNSEQINLLELIPERLFSHSVSDEEGVIVDMPRFHVPWMQKYLVPATKNPFIKIKLDAFGSHVWNLCDGNKNIGEISESLTGQFGDEVQPVHERLATFFRQLKDRGFVRLRKADGSYI